MHETSPHVEYPTIAQYDEAMLHPSSFLRNAGDDVRLGSVVVAPRADGLGGDARPWVTSGAFAAVYQFTTAGGRRKALRCFKTPPIADLAARYQLLDPYLREHAPEFTHTVKYIPDGIRVRQADDSFPAFPLLVMDWIEGEPLSKALARACLNNDRREIQRLYKAWREMLWRLHLGRMAHGDLATGNILVRPDGGLTLVDYDGFYIPPLEGWPSVVEGQQDYQHPRLAARAFDEQMDAFSGLLITTAILALRHSPSLWGRLNAASGDTATEHLLFTRRDLQAPHESPVFRAIAENQDDDVGIALNALARACGGTPDATPFALQAVEQRFFVSGISAALEDAVQHKDPTAVASRWTWACDNETALRTYRSAIEQARRWLVAYARLQEAIDSADDARILARAEEVPAGYRLPAEAEARVALARQRSPELNRLREIVANRDDRALLEAWDSGTAALAPSLSAEERAWCDAVLTPWRASQDVDALLAQGRVEEALTRAVEARLRRTDVPFLTASRTFLAQRAPTDLRAWLTGQRLEVRWVWPQSPLVGAVRIHWNALSPLPNGKVAHGSWEVTRIPFQHEGMCSFTREGLDALRVRASAALAGSDNRPSTQDTVDPVNDVGQECVARPLCCVRCRMIKRRGARNTLELQTSDGSPLPSLVVVAREGGSLPLAPSDGVVIWETGAGTTANPARLERACNVAIGSVLRVFPKRQGDSDWIRIEGEHGVRMDVR